MSKYSKLIIFILVLVLVSAAIVLIDSSMDNINKSMPEISDYIAKGDADYNEAVDLVNDKYFYDGMDKLNSAEENYNKSLNALSIIKNNFTGDIDEVHKQYIDTVYTEVELKLDAVGKFKEAIECFQIEANVTGTGYASEANDYMYQAYEYQNASYEIIEEHPDLFKHNFIFN